MYVIKRLNTNLLRKDRKECLRYLDYAKLLSCDKSSNNFNYNYARINNFHCGAIRCDQIEDSSGSGNNEGELVMAMAVVLPQEHSNNLEKYLKYMNQQEIFEDHTSSATGILNIGRRQSIPTDLLAAPILANTRQVIVRYCFKNRDNIEDGKGRETEEKMVKEKPEHSSKVEETVKHIKEDIKHGEVKPSTKRPWYKRVEDELLHYYHGFRLLFIDMRIASGLLWRVIKGKPLTRREYRQLTRTTSDVFRLVPFSVFIIVPFMELALPIFLKLFPNMLPSTFTTKNDHEAKMRAQLKVKLEMAKFLTNTLDDMALESKGHSSDKAKEFAKFFEKIRSSGHEVTNEEIVKFSKLFEDEITLDALSRPQLLALCRVLELPPYGTTAILRFQLKMKLKRLHTDDREIEKEGLDNLTHSELQKACQARGMRALGVPDDRLRRQLEQWLQLSLYEKIPPSLLLLSRAMYLPENLPPTAQLQATIQALPDAAATTAKASIGELEGKVDNKTRVEILKEEQRKIKEERWEQDHPDGVKQPKGFLKGLIKKDKHHTVPLTSELGPSGQIIEKIDLAETEQLISKKEKKFKNLLEDKELKLEKTEIEELKGEMADYVQDLQDLTKVKDKTDLELEESKAASRLYTRVNKLITNMDNMVEKLETEKEKKEKKAQKSQSEDKGSQA